MPSTGVFRMACTCQMRLLVVAPAGLQEGIDGLLGGRCGGEVRRIGLGKHGRGGRAGAAGAQIGARGRGRNLLLGSGLKKGRNNATSAATLAKRTDRRIKLILLKLREKLPMVMR
jgi:hypothetical protein